MIDLENKLLEAKRYILDIEMHCLELAKDILNPIFSYPGLDYIWFDSTENYELSLIIHGEISCIDYLIADSQDPWKSYFKTLYDYTDTITGLFRIISKTDTYGYLTNKGIVFSSRPRKKK